MIVNNINQYQGLQNAYRPDKENEGTTDNRQVSSGGQGLSDLIVVHDPPFFPIATYQRQDLIKKVRSLEGEARQPVRDQGSQNMPLANKLKNDATEAVRVVTSGNIKPGAVLSVKA